MTPMDEREAVALLRRQGLSPERCGEADWRRAVAEVVEQSLMASARPLRPLGASLARRSGLPSKPPTALTAFLPTREAACATCDDAQFILTASHEIAPGVVVRGHAVPCPSCVPLSMRAALAGIPERFCGARLDAAIERPGNAAALAMARSWDGRTSVVLASRADPGDSPYGTGKTHIACAMLIWQIEWARPARFLSEQDYLEGMKALFGGDGGAAQEYADRVAAEPLLLIDDVGKAQATEWTAAAMFRLLDARYRAQRPTIITTNASYGELVARLGAALVDRLNDALWVFVGGESFRGAA